ncbi:MAG: ribosome maturation factor RimM [Tepidiforma sp.]|uniref:ribosome maturation factor RimM n=1 Tax=Tepidiforma sp. TaxID=2682230 RepID=UPI0021DF2545|nr:ribosome maturation factor RimM [Tepidiforma sp.]GIW16550.1 MAG: ribosome maturation factor RimM [Tepidiforma sp.]
MTLPAEPRPGYTAVARVLRPHALRGELRVEVFSPTARNIQRGRPVYLQGIRRVVERARQAGDDWIIKLSGLDTRTQVEHLHGELLEALDSDVLRDDSESYFIYELIGLEVVTASGESLGTIVEVLQPGANDVYVVHGERGEILVPAIGQVVREINLGARRVVITPLPGMLDESP